MGLESNEEAPMYRSSPDALKSLTDDWFESQFRPLLGGPAIDGPIALTAFEEAVEAGVRNLMSSLVGHVLANVIEDPTLAEDAGQRARDKSERPLRNVARKEVSITMLSGNQARVTTSYYRPKPVRRGRKKTKRGKSGSGMFPVLEALGIKDRCTPALRARIAREVTAGPSMEVARERLVDRGCSLDIKSVQRISESFAEDALALRRATMNGDAPSCIDDESMDGARVLVCIDGGRIRTRKKKRGRLKQDKHRHGYFAPWREPKVMTICRIGPDGRKERPSVPIYDGTLGNYDEAFALLEMHLRALHVDDAEMVVFAADGASAIWPRVDLVIERLGLAQDRVRKVVDFVHAVGHLWEVANLKSWTDREKGRWVKAAKKVLKVGDIDRLLEMIRAIAIGRKGRRIRKKGDYFERYQNEMQYASMLEENLPIGSGVVESAIRRVVNLRLKGPGMFWKEENAEGFLQLRCYLVSGRWDRLTSAVSVFTGL